ncbi:paired box protein Pax-6-like [Ctenocephalides felis]|uniref:paired box protein Pax-6-like n=1 Tax=Ctenocephalides felis TaxID=7515 RepID=UPI000E6E3D44|nr:paired box protein Pax-6-like [Ctenocephalides felis]XP_026473710.1 paired box protein Pax-6-like [Ctenocephalides felis]
MSSMSGFAHPGNATNNAAATGLNVPVTGSASMSGASCGLRQRPDSAPTYNYTLPLPTTGYEFYHHHRHHLAYVFETRLSDKPVRSEWSASLISPGVSVPIAVPRQHPELSVQYWPRLQ